MPHPVQVDNNAYGTILHIASAREVENPQTLLLAVYFITSSQRDEKKSGIINKEKRSTSQ